MRITAIAALMIDLLFPPSKEELLVRQLTTRELTTLREEVVVGGVTALLPYQDPRVRALIHRAKYSKDARAIELLADLLAEKLSSMSTPHILVPIPLSRRRKNARGYNQSEVIGVRALQHSPHTMMDSLLVRTRDTTPQTQLSRTERKTNLVGAFAVNNDVVLPKNTPLILFDDVTTTGSTLLEAQRVLKQAGLTTISLIALAH